jgi:signal transduction histidine kinase
VNARIYHIVLISFISAQWACAQTDTLLIGKDFKGISANSYFNYFNTDAEITADSAWKVFTQKTNSLKRINKINFGPINGYYWLALTVKNTSNKRQELYLEIRQPHLYRIVFNRVFRDSVVTQFETGIHFNFFKRPLPNRFFDFPVTCEPGESFTMLVQVHHINSLSLPLYIVTNEALQQNNYRENLVWGFWLGFLSFCTMSSFIAFLFFRKSVFLWYFFYILTAALYGFTEQGFSFQYLFPRLADFEAPAIIHLGVYGFVFLIKFSQGLLETRKHFLLVHKILNWVFYFTLVFIVAGYLMPGFMFRFSTIVLPTLNIDVLVGLGLLSYCGIKSLWTNKVIAIFYLVAYGTLIAASVFSISNYGFGAFQYFGPNPVLISYFLEAILLSVALIILFRQIQKERSALIATVATQQKEMYKNFIGGIEKERNRIAGELHDDIGSRLSFLQRLLSTHSEESKKTSDQLEQIIKDVRQLSHDLAPPLAHVSGLIPLLEKLISDIRQSTGLNIKFQEYDFKRELSTEQIQQVYRIVQEALNNIAKHAGASKIDVQVFGHKNEVDIIIEDNGKGFDISQPTGLGINQMKIRTDSIGGRLEINSHPGKGTTILLQVPFDSTKK